MKFVLLAFLVAVGGATGTPPDNLRIVGGTTAKLGDVPYIVSLRIFAVHNCGGSIISKTFVLSAAHCFFKKETDIRAHSIQYGVIRMDRFEPNVLPAKRITMHPDYKDGNGFFNDVAIVEIDGDIQFGPNVAPVTLPSAFEVPALNAQALLAGWGQSRTKPIMYDLQKVFIQVYDNAACQRMEPNYRPQLHICAGVPKGGKGQCRGDSGGPLTIGGKQFGIVSWSKKPCGQAIHPGVFAKVANYRAWIQQISGV